MVRMNSEKPIFSLANFVRDFVGIQPNYVSRNENYTVFSKIFYSGSKIFVKNVRNRIVLDFE